MKFEHTYFGRPQLRHRNRPLFKESSPMKNQRLITALVTSALLWFPAATAKAALVGHYTFDDPINRFADSSGAGHNGTVLGAAPDIQVIADAGGAQKSASDVLDMTGAAQTAVDLGTWDPSGPNFGSFSLATWVNWSSEPGNVGGNRNSAIMSKSDNWDGSDMLFLWMLDFNPNPERFGEASIFNGVFDQARTDNFTDPLPTEEWVHLAMVNDGDSQNATHYINGVEKASDFWSPTAGTNATIYLGALGDTIFNDEATEHPGNNFTGQMDDFRIFNHALTGAEVTTIFEDGAGGIDGDFDADGDVDGADFLKWQRKLGDAANLVKWQDNFGTTTAAAAVNAVPEPASWILICTMTLATTRWRRRS